MRSVTIIIGKMRWIMAVLGLFLLGGVGYYLLPAYLDDREVASLAGSLQDKTVLIDAGHGGGDGGTKGKQGTLEKDINLAIAKKVAEHLRQSNIRVVMTRETDANLFTGPWTQRDELTKRVEVARENKADIYVAIHANSFSAKSSGAQVFYQPGSEEGKRLALHIQHQLVERIGNKDKRVATDEDYFVLRTSHCPAVMVEVGFLSNPTEETMLKSDSHQETIAKGIFAGIVHHLSGEPAPTSKAGSKEKTDQPATDQEKEPVAGEPQA
ncbi:N-acetylmuramoyl-L-alanine amidase family protein [Heliophilum fasciatum]|uniref:N-acetylmuramoyl-L-alanine amidase n=1 Tax=Heliophilum fasciatum TaxID=35700 RepID=A0A4R2RE50_9FIRM|nr:N-acetylmuramoyl-L-alanine amidase [Heliophilum fasciatum]MCW2278981.1 N-acetylmuramoyl-L-alanine amidase [Heliophilum fasciatum]TCP61770.1 N-acetylmuramoyl-L-alanine amidase [Heliophilum fasciatum]